MEAAAIAASRGGSARFVALDLQHAPIDCELNGAFVRLLDSSAFTLGVEVDRFEAEFAAWRNSHLHCGAVPNAEAWAAEELSLPMHPDLRPDEIERVGEAVHAAAVRVSNARSGENRC